MDALQPIKRLFNTANILDRLENVESASGIQPSMSMDTLDEVTTRTGELVVDRLICPAPSVEVTDPTSPDFTGTFMDGTGIEFSGKKYHIGGVDAGDLQCGICSTDGTLYAGAIVLDISGITVNNTSSSFRFQATNDTFSRVGTIGMKIDGSTDAPYFYFGYGSEPSTDNLVSNPGFETGDFTNWIASPSTNFSVCTNATLPVVTTVPDGSYCACWSWIGSVSSTDTLISDSFSTTDSAEFYTFSVKYYGTIPGATGSGVSAFIETRVNWYDSTGGLISQSSATSNTGIQNSWITATETIRKPGGAVAAAVWISPITQSALQSYVLFDTITLSPSGIYNQFWFSKAHAQLVTNGESNNISRYVFVDGNISPYGVGPTLSASTSSSTNRIPPGTYYYKVAWTDGDGITTASPASSITTTDVDNSSFVLVSWGDIFPIGATGAIIYRSDNAGVDYYKIGETTSSSGYLDYAPSVDTSADIPTNINATTQRPSIPPFAELNAARGIQAVGTGRAVVSGATPAAYYKIAATGNSNDGDAEDFGIWISAGTYRIESIGPTSATSGKTDWYIDGVSVATGIDHYSASTSHYVTKSITAGVVIATSGYHIIRWKINGKNASSSDYVFGLSYVMIYPASSY